MFDTATKQLVRQIDPSGGGLIPASLIDSKKLKLLAVVWKKPKMWFFQKAKYSPSPFTINDLLDEGEIKPVRDETDFMKCKATFQRAAGGSAEVGNKIVGLNVSGEGKSKLSLSLGTLRKEDMHIPILLKDIMGKKVNLKHSLIQQSLKGKLMLTLLKERIFTMCECSISHTGQEQGSCSTSFKGDPEMLVMKAKGELKCDSELEMSIPAGTVIAYSVIKMSISSDGYIDLYFGPDGIEADDIYEGPDYSDDLEGPWALQQIEEGSSLSSLKMVLSDVQTKFCVLTDLTSERRSLLLHLRKILLDRPSLSVLVERLEILRSGEAPLLAEELLDNQSHLIGEVLDLLECEPHNQSGITAASSTANHSEILMAMLMLLSAIEEMTDAGLQLLESFCSPEGLRSLQDLVNLLMANSEPLSKDAIPVFLQKDDEFHRVVDLFKSCSVLLKREEDLMFADITCEKGFLPFDLCIAVSGLACLIDTQ